MAGQVKLELELKNVYGKFLGEKVDVIFRHQVLSEVKKASINATGSRAIGGLREGRPLGTTGRSMMSAPYGRPVVSRLNCCF